MVLGHSLRRTGTKHALICLHTADVPPGFIKLLSLIWECRVIEHVNACTQKLSFQDDQPHRFDKVFTKLRVLALTDFAKILLMDIDLIVMDNIDELFDLPAPAALRRGMNDSRWPLKTGDSVDGRPFFGGRDASNPKWSWGQGTGINAGVMLLQPSMTVLNDMLVEISEPNHPSHAQGNGPEQDYLSRYWADAPWHYIGVEYNFQLHQMFFALHPNWASMAERAEFFRSPEKIKVVHFSGVPAAKPWHRVLDEKFAAYWPDRSRDVEYRNKFADEFLGHWLWIKKDTATWGDMNSRHQRSEMQDLYLGEDGDIWKKPWDWKAGKPTKVEIPAEAKTGSMSILDRALEGWFDCFLELEQSLGMDLKREIAVAAREKGPAPPEPAPAPRELASRPWGGKADTGGTGTAEAGTTPVERSLEGGKDAATAVAAFRWKRAGGWWVEQSQDKHERLTVVCSAINGRPYISFCEGGLETFGERDDETLSGLFVKVAGPHCARHFPLPALEGTSEEIAEQLENAVAPISIWANGVPLREAVMVAMVGMPSEAVTPVLAALAPLGVPSFEGSSSDCCAFAAVGHRPDPNAPTEKSTEKGASGGWFGEKRGNASANSQAAARKFGGVQTWTSAHASRDVAYASMPLSCSSNQGNV